VRTSKPAPGVERVQAPGDPERARRAANAGTCPLPADVLEKLVAVGSRLGVPTASITTR
jgi:LDH2 family malate/lactate/ureidoglycolate dehydrogenase